MIASLYAAVGSGGGTGYLAVMGVVGMTPEVMRPVALIFNVLVTSISAFQFVRAGYFAGRIFWPLVALSIPAAFVGGRLDVAAEIYRPVVGVVLIIAAWRMAASSGEKQTSPAADNPSPYRTNPTRLPILLLAGGGIGFVSGLLGIGGGIFLGPLLLFTRWSTTREMVGISAAFVLVNSSAGLAGRLTALPVLPVGLWVWLPAVALGGYFGATVAAYRLNQKWIRRMLAVVLIFGGIRMIWSL